MRRDDNKRLAFYAGQKVRVRWTNSGADYTAEGVVMRPNARTVRVHVTGATVERVANRWHGDALGPAPRSDFECPFPVPGTHGNGVEALEFDAESNDAYRERQRERAESKADRAETFEEKAKRQAAALNDSARQRLEAIPLGQPILTDHYSAGRDRRYRARIFSTFDRARERADVADYWARKADRAERDADSWS